MWLKREGGAYGFAAIGTIHCSVCVVGPSRECRRSSCANGGRCVQQWDSYYCDCDLTTFTGPTCSDGTISSQSNWSVFLLYYRFLPAASPTSHHFHPSLSPVVSLYLGILHEWMRTQMLAKPCSNLLQRTGGDHRGGRAQPG